MFGGDEEEEEECLSVKWGGYMEDGLKRYKSFWYTLGYKWLLNVTQMLYFLR